MKFRENLEKGCKRTYLFCRDKKNTYFPNGTARFKNVHICLNTNIYSYLETSGAKSLSESRECFIEVYINNRCKVTIVYCEKIYIDKRSYFIIVYLSRSLGGLTEVK